MECVEDVECLTKCGLGNVQRHPQDQQHRRRSHCFVWLVWSQSHQAFVWTSSWWLVATSEDGLSSADMRILLDRINSGTRSSFVFSVEHKFWLSSDKRKQYGRTKVLGEGGERSSLLNLINLPHRTTGHPFRGDVRVCPSRWGADDDRTCLLTTKFYARYSVARTISIISWVPRLE